MIGWMSPIVVKVWDKIGPVVEYECLQRPEEPDFYESAIKLAEYELGGQTNRDFL
jgi:hypothetical protein